MAKKNGDAALFAKLNKKINEQFDRDDQRTASSGGTFVEKVEVEWFYTNRNIDDANKVTLRLVPDMTNGLLFLPIKVHTFRTDQLRSWMDYDWLLGRNNPGIDDEIITLREFMVEKGKLTQAMVKAWNEVNDPAQEIARAMKKAGYDNKVIPWARSKFLWNVWNPKEKSVQVYESGKQFKDMVQSLLSATPDLYDPTSGKNLIINVTKGNPNTYSPPILARRKSSIRKSAVQLVEETYNLYEVAMGYKFCDFKYKIDRTFNALGKYAEELDISAQPFLDTLLKFEGGTPSDDNAPF